MWTQGQWPWVLWAKCPLGAPFDGPIEIGVRLAPTAEAVEDADQYGVPADALRTFPLREVKAQARSLLPAVRRALGQASQLPDLPQACRNPADYAKWALAYLILQEDKTSSPVKVLMEMTGMAQSTVSTRLAKARKLGFLGPDGRARAEAAIEVYEEGRSN